MTNGGLQCRHTTRELARMCRQAGIDFPSLPDGNSTARWGSRPAQPIFSTTGGVMEATLRTVYEVITGRELPLTAPRGSIMGFERIKS